MIYTLFCENYAPNKKQKKKIRLLQIFTGQITRKKTSVPSHVSRAVRGSNKTLSSQAINPTDKCAGFKRPIIICIITIIILMANCQDTWKNVLLLSSCDTDAEEVLWGKRCELLHIICIVYVYDRGVTAGSIAAICCFKMSSMTTDLSLMRSINNARLDCTMANVLEMIIL